MSLACVQGIYNQIEEMRVISFRDLHFGSDPWRI